MKAKTRNSIINIILLSLIGGLIWLLLFGMVGCEVLKHKRSSAVDSTSSHRIDTVRLLVKDSGSKTDATWYREILSYLPQGRDTTINNTTVPVNNYYPTKVIREGGTFSREDYLHLVDSMNAHKSDSTHVAAVVETKDKSVKVLNMWQIIGLMLGCLLVFEGLKWVKNNVGIKKKL